MKQESFMMEDRIPETLAAMKLSLRRVGRSVPAMISETAAAGYDTIRGSTSGKRYMIFRVKSVATALQLEESMTEK